MGDYEVVPLVMDNGSYTCKAGFAAKDAPKAVFPTVVGSPNRNWIGLTGDPFYYGQKAQDMTDKLNLRHPVERGVIPTSFTSWDDMEEVRGGKKWCTFKKGCNV